MGKEPKLPSDITHPSIKIYNRLNVNTDPFTQNEFKTVINKVKSSKAFGPDNIPTIDWKDSHFHYLLRNLPNLMFLHKKGPDIWRRSQIISVPKKGDLSLPQTIEAFHCSPLQPTFIINYY